MVLEYGVRVRKFPGSWMDRRVYLAVSCMILAFGRALQLLEIVDYCIFHKTTYFSILEKHSKFDKTDQR